MTSGSEDPFEGWEMWSAGCHWSRPLPDGRTVSMSTWSCGARTGYSLTVDFTTRVFPGLDEAKAAFAVLEQSPPGTSICAAPGALPDGDDESGTRQD